MRCGSYRRRSAWMSSKASSTWWHRRFLPSRKRAWLTPSTKRTTPTWWTGRPRSQNCAGEFATQGELQAHQEGGGQPRRPHRFLARTLRVGYGHLDKLERSIEALDRGDFEGPE